MENSLRTLIPYDVQDLQQNRDIVSDGLVLELALGIHKSLCVKAPRTLSGLVMVLPRRNTRSSALYMGKASYAEMYAFGSFRSPVRLIVSLSKSIVDAYLQTQVLLVIRPVVGLRTEDRVAILSRIVVRLLTVELDYMCVKISWGVN